MSQARHFPEPPSTAQELDAMLHHIDVGDGDLASLSDEQREQLKSELSDAWLADYLDDYPVPADRRQAAQEYRAIAAGKKYPNLTDHVRADLLLQFEERHGEGGPDHWKLQE